MLVALFASVPEPGLFEPAVMVNTPTELTVFVAPDIAKLPPGVIGFPELLPVTVI